MTRAYATFYQNDGQVTQAYYAEMNTFGHEGQLAVALFRAQKRSDAAKRYRGRSFRGEAYEVKNWSLGEICRLLSGPDHNFVWGWKRDPNTPGFEWVLYVELPTGQVSFHSASRLAGPDYRGEWDGQKGASTQRIIDFCNQVEDAAKGVTF